MPFSFPNPLYNSLVPLREPQSQIRYVRICEDSWSGYQHQTALTAIPFTCSGTQRLARSLTCWTNRFYSARNRISLLRHLNRPTLAPMYPISDRFIQFSKHLYLSHFQNHLFNQHTYKIHFANHFIWDRYLSKLFFPKTIRKQWFYNYRGYVT